MVQRKLLFGLTALGCALTPATADDRPGAAADRTASPMDDSPMAKAANGRGAPHPGWQVGVMTMVSRSPFAGDGTYMRVLPALRYQNRRFVLRGLQAGYRLFPGDEKGKGPRLSLDVITALRLQPGAERKKASLDAGLRLTYRMRPAALSLTFRQDISGVHGGQEASARLSRPFRAGAFTFIPAVEAEWQSRTLANHLWGTSLSQHQKAAGQGFGDALPVYKIGGPVLNYGTSLVGVYRIGTRWSLSGLVKARFLDHRAADNPGIIHRTDLKAGLGLSYRF